MSWDLSFGKSFRIVVIKVKVRGTKFPKRELDEFWDGRIFLDSGLTVLSYQFFERILIFYKSLRGGGGVSHFPHTHAYNVWCFIIECCNIAHARANMHNVVIKTGGVKNFPYKTKSECNQRIGQSRKTVLGFGELQCLFETNYEILKIWRCEFGNIVYYFHSYCKFDWKLNIFPSYFWMQTIVQFRK